MHRFYCHPDIDLEVYIIDGLGSIVTKNIDGHEFPSLPELANGLMLLDHLRHHLETGVGLRQLIDWKYYVESVLDDEMWNTEFGPDVRDLGLERFAINITFVCKNYIGLDRSCAS